MPLSLSPATLSDGPGIAHTLISAFINDPFNKVLFPGCSYDFLVAENIARWPSVLAAPGALLMKVCDEETGEIVSFARWVKKVPGGAGGEEGKGKREEKGEEEKGGEGEGGAIDAGSKEENEISGIENELDGSLKLQAVKEPDLPPPCPPPPRKGMNIPFRDEFQAKVHAMQAEHLGDRPQLCLELLATHPSHQRRGAASMHLSWARQLADKERLTLWLDSSPVGVQVYLKNGFRVVGEVRTELWRWTEGEGEGEGAYVTRGMRRDVGEGVYVHKGMRRDIGVEGEGD